jgi:hypothetical protein
VSKLNKIKYLKESIGCLTAVILFILALKGCKTDPPLITGRVISKWDEKPVKNAEVMVMSINEGEGKTFGPVATDSYGKFAIEIKDSTVRYKMVVIDKNHEEYTLNSFSPKEIREVQLKPNSTKKGFPTPPVTGTDLAGKKAVFEFHSLTTNHGWRLGSNEEIESQISPNQKIKVQSFLQERLSNLNVKERIRQSKDLIAVGVASCEGSKTEEEERAEKRARVIQTTLADTSTAHNVYLLLLGQYQSKGCEIDKNTIKQRQLIVIYVIDKENGVSMKEALSNAREQLIKYLKNESDSPLGILLLKNYSLNELRIN